MSSYYKDFYHLLNSDRVDQHKTQIFDDWYASLPEDERAICDCKLKALMQVLTETQAKALLVNTIVLVNARPDEREPLIEHGEYLRAQFEWSQVVR